MKKILLLIVSGLLIACMAGSAMANPAGMEVRLNGNLIGPGTSITVTPGNEYTLDVKTFLIDYGFTSNQDMPRQITVSSTSFGSGTVEAKLLAPSGSWTAYGTSVTDTYTAKYPTGDYTYQVKFIANSKGHIDIRDAGSNDNSATYTIDVAQEGYGLNIPEFPTVALPIAAILGLVFIFGRKKEEL
ncbi:hypothetical protein EO98_10525 [Methanosarcina sp. 2.H.T.1A.6]|uniref:PEF-CTERM sorting domain-containing protein n=1 Tax=unclassified Methanosarcina TaxID=2644672 RepID=UPI0006216D25|nr:MULTISPECIES: PEF-CTERM sorting domain-containing protein [unclassified Methanosarcina]KKG15904.1 hypothetical protein EO97_04255 [Methanosarcina sp. 2.H.T.1A.15]KKG17475.1 hypothetical protein EO94_10065 [Methanosarcina sp. 2.H.T.1A.3]KKG23304.1 hypothetical protein EO98_10525 [Methanosarcina sp. 2.H.T.1A.6]KKG25880.1 hypothetical protein EO96_11125 [Methanosarcina sp. 2.H.T.1A.8]